jgi:riboflavin-specific deaminase-like protein
VQLRRLHPEPTMLTVDEAASGLKLGDLAPSDRPYVVANMVSTADGKATVGGRTREIADDADRLLFHHLRTQADAILAGTGTLRIERYGPLLRDEEMRAKREREGFAPVPLAVVISRSGEIPFEAPLFHDPESKIVVFTAAEADPPACEAQVEVTRVSPDELTLDNVLRRLRSDHDVRALMCEGGPTLLSSLVADGLLDELFLTIAPMLVSGSDTLTILHGMPLPDTRKLELVSLLEHDNYLFARYRVHS